MKRFLITALVCICSMMLCGSEFSVKKFGAKGDGKTDDTAAIRKAVEAAGKKCRSRRSYRSTTRTSYYGAGVTVTFPAGIYKITDTINVPNYVSLKGENARPILEWGGADEKKGVMFKVSAFRNDIEKLIFVGGGVQLFFTNKNTDKTMITVRDCQFLFAGEFAIKMEPVAPADHMSVQCTISNCLFSKNYRCVQNFGDLMAIRECWIDAAQPQLCDGAMIVNKYGTLLMQFCCLVPSANPDKGPNYYHNARWVDNYGRFEAESVRFGGEGGGIPAVYHYGTVSNSHPFAGGSKVRFSNCMLSFGQTRRANGCAIRLFRLPQQLIIENNTNSYNHPFIVCDPSLDIAKELKNHRVIPHIVWRVYGNIQNMMIPKELKRFFKPGSEAVFADVITKPVPAEVTIGKKK